MWYILLFVLLALTALFLFSWFRVQWVIDDDEAFIFIGLGRTGFFYNLKTHSGKLRLFGFLIQPPERKKVKPETEPKKTTNKLRALSHTFTSIGKIKNITRTFGKSGKAFLHFGYCILKRLIIEELRIHVTAGFDSPDQTGRAVGWYYSIIGAIPSLQKRILFTPVWDHAELQGDIRVSIAIPVYRTVIPFFQLLRELPFKEIITIVRENTKRSKVWKTT